MDVQRGIHELVSIPQYRSGQFRPHVQRSGAKQRATESQSLNTDQGSSEGHLSRPWRVLPRKSLNPSIQIRAVPTAGLVSPLNRCSSDADFRYPPGEAPNPGLGQQFQGGGIAVYLKRIQRVTHVSVTSPSKWRFELGMLL